ncbi:MAG: hypothetical protein ACK5RG_21735 [Cyclobacteriaceae bacterium]|jgi:hypothetical protein
MNQIKTIQVDEIRYASRTLETILLINENKAEKVVYLYNYDGIHFRVFENVFEVGNFFNGINYQILKEYSHERWVDRFLERYKFV